jgi:hypothetical protein
MQPTRIALALAAAALVAGCATNLTPGGMQVKYVTTPSEVAGCKPLGPVRPETQVSRSGSLPGDIESEQESSARIEARNQASALGATHVLIDEAKHPSLDEGTAYRCGGKATGGL